MCANSLDKEAALVSFSSGNTQVSHVSQKFMNHALRKPLGQVAAERAAYCTVNDTFGGLCMLSVAEGSSKAFRSSCRRAKQGMLIRTLNTARMLEVT